MNKTWDKDKELCLKAQPIQDRVYREVFGEDIKILRTEREHNELLDREHHIDTNIVLPSGGRLTFQEKALREEFASFDTFTMEYEQNRTTGEGGEFFRISAQYYLHGYLNAEETEYLKWYIIDIPKAIVFFDGVSNLRYFVKLDKNSNANFIAMPYGLIEDCVFAKGLLRVC